VLVAAAMIILKKHREKIMIAGVVILCLVNGVYTFTRAEGILPTRHPFNQTFYTSDYLETQEFPDAFLKLYLDGKTVYVKDDPITNEEAVAAGFYWQYNVCHYHNMVHFMESVGATVIPEKTMNESVVTEKNSDDFESLGYVNDMLRNTMMYSGIDNEIGNFLYYLYYYRDLSGTAYFFVNTDGLMDADELVLIWQNQEENKHSEDMYLMTKEYYDTVYK